ncbi:MAG: Uma2 family endonuclease [Planctomycetes bacterium]|nr:Uma2 family endonuclease [Planctomycetota bacterium]
MTIKLTGELRGGTPPLAPITVDQIDRMIEAGILQDGEPIELIDGMLVCKDRSACGEDHMTHHPRHALLISRLQRLLTASCASAGSFLRIQLPVALSNISAPEPDLAVVRGTEEDYADRHPGPADLVLVIEVADSSLAADRSTKQRLYATAGIPQYWLINLPQSQVEIYERPEPASGTYSQQTIKKPGQILASQLSTSLHVEMGVADLFR